MFLLLVAVAILEHLETVDASVDMLDLDSIPRQATVERFLLVR
jgi:hypothetical protein